MIQLYLKSYEVKFGNFERCTMESKYDYLLFGIKKKKIKPLLSLRMDLLRKWIKYHLTKLIGQLE